MSIKHLAGQLDKYLSQWLSQAAHRKSELNALQPHPYLKFKKDSFTNQLPSNSLDPQKYQISYLTLLFAIK